MAKKNRFEQTGRHTDYCDICRKMRMIERRPEMDYTDNIGQMEVTACDDCAEMETEIEPPDAADMSER